MFISDELPHYIRTIEADLFYYEDSKAINPPRQEMTEIAVSSNQSPVLVTNDQSQNGASRKSRSSLTKGKQGENTERLGK